MTNLERVLLRWNGQALVLVPPRQPDEVIQSLTRTGKRFANDVVKMYCATGGMDDGRTDDLNLSLWPLWKVQMINTDSVGADLEFGDVLIESFRYFLRCEDESHSSVYGGYDSRKLADSIEEFWEFYLNDPHKLDLY